MGISSSLTSFQFVTNTGTNNGITHQENQSAKQSTRKLTIHEPRKSQRPEQGMCTRLRLKEIKESMTCKG